MTSISAEDIQVLTHRDPEHPDRDCWVRLVFNGQVFDGTSARTQNENRLVASRELIQSTVMESGVITSPKYVIFECVTTLSPSSPRQGRVRRLVWHHKDGCWNYYLECDGKKVSKRYLDSDLKPAEQGAQPDAFGAGQL